MIALIVVTGAVVSLQPDGEVKTKEVPLTRALERLGSWECVGARQLEEGVVAALDLDDYAYMRYKKNNDIVSLYVGYYFSSLKIGAAHDPMVCFPGQGWKVSERSRGRVAVRPGMTVGYSMMTAQLGEKRSLIVYWFQAHDSPNTSTFTQKLALIWKKVIYNDEGNAFVRLTIPIDDGPMEHYRQLAGMFIKDFYPVFLTYVES
nr:exosortase C-terminal domain/associated protein EpsI [Desulfoluna limicola]